MCVGFWSDDHYMSRTANYAVVRVVPGADLGPVRSFVGPGELAVSSVPEMVLWYSAPQGLEDKGSIEALGPEGATLWVRAVDGGRQAISHAGDVVNVPGCGDPGRADSSRRGTVFSCSGEDVGEFVGCSHLPPVWDTDGSRFYFVSPGRSSGRDSLRCCTRGGRVLWSRHIGTEGAMLSRECRTLSAGRGVVAVISLDFPPRGEPISLAKRVLSVYDAAGESLFSVDGPSDHGPVSCAVSADGQRVVTVVPEEPLQRNLARWVVRTYSATSHALQSELLFPSMSDSLERVRLTGLSVSSEGRVAVVGGPRARKDGPWLIAVYEDGFVSTLRGTGTSAPRCTWMTEDTLLVELGDAAALYELAAPEIGGGQ